MIFIKRHDLLVQTYYDGRSDFLTEVQDMPTYQAWNLHEKRDVHLMQALNALTVSRPQTKNREESTGCKTIDT